MTLRSSRAPGPNVQTLLALIDEAYDHRSWHGTNLRGSLRGMPAVVAARRPAPGRHNIQEIVVHCAYWKYTVWRRITGAKRGSFPLAGSDWFPRPDAPHDRLWRTDIALLGEMHRTLRDTIAALPDRRLTASPGGRQFTIAQLVTGIAAHDLYHAGQIQLIKRLVR